MNGGEAPSLIHTDVANQLVPGGGLVGGGHHVGAAGVAPILTIFDREGSGDAAAESGGVGDLTLTIREASPGVGVVDERRHHGVVARRDAEREASPLNHGRFNGQGIVLGARGGGHETKRC